MNTVIDEFADIKVMRFEVPGWEDLSLRQKEYAYHLSEAAKLGRDITWDQYCRWNLPIRHAVEAILEGYRGDRDCQEFRVFLVYAKRLFFSSGIHHHYAEDKFFPPCPPEYFKGLLEAVGLSDEAQGLVEAVYSPDICPKRRSDSKEGDIVAQSSVNFYEGVTRDEVEEYYSALEDSSDPHPVALGLNTKVVKENEALTEKVWKSGGLYSQAIERICSELSKAKDVAENDRQKEALNLLIDYYRTGDLKVWDAFNVAWTGETIGTVDFINGFIEDYDDPLGRKATWEGYVHIKDTVASARTDKLCSNAQWFEDHSPVDPRFRKKEVKGVSAKVVTAVTLGGACYPTTPIGINLPNSDWIRKEHGSKSVTIANITMAYDKAALEAPRSALEEFAFDKDEIEAYKRYGPYDDEIHTDLHECLGHGSGQLLPGVSPTALGEYQSTLEEARADLFALYFIADPKMVELGILPDLEAWKPSYSSYIRNGIFVQFSRVEPGKKNTEAHMQNRKLIAQWCYEHGLEGNVIEKKVRDGKTYFVVNDFEALRGLVADLLAEVQRIKSEGDYEAGKALVENYAVDIDPVLHKEVRERYLALGLKPYGGFVNPDIVPVEKNGRIIDYTISYAGDYLAQQLLYGKNYKTL
ncbi:MAG: dihydrofolate reductase [Bacteroidales bacterium]|nr:dihydrofolate reductase [Bacteroidales bacterium]